MKAIRKSDGKVIEVEETTAYDGELGYWDNENCDFHYPSELDFNVEESEEVTIGGWVARDKNGYLFIYAHKPERNFIKSYWEDEVSDIPPDNGLFPDITWESDPLEVTVIIKPKKKLSTE